jgi:KUP system potassium uptake protein
MTTWQRGRVIVTARRTEQEGSLREFIDKLHERPVPRVTGAAVFPHPSKETAPLALRANVRYNHVLHENVVIVSARPQNVPLIGADQRMQVDDLGYDDDGIFHLTLHYGFSETPDIPTALRQAREDGRLEVDLDPDEASYFLSRASLRPARGPGFNRWRKLLFVTMAHNAANPAEYFGLPPDRTVVMGTHIDL